jgi:activating signal cointegrator complex subunit 3
VKEKVPLRRIEVMTNICYERARTVVDGGQQVMVFVHARKDTVRTAQSLLEKAKEANESAIFQIHEDLPGAVLALKEVSKSRNRELRELFPFGFGIHHAGMLRSDRNLAERMFTKGFIKVLICTATLAWGVNLPAHCVIIKVCLLFFFFSFFF